MAQTWRRPLVGIAVLVALVAAPPASAASQGSLGAISRGSLVISITIRAPTRVSGLADFALDAGSTASARDVCLRGAPHAYTLAASGSGPGGALSLSNGDERIAYRVEWQSRAGTNPVDALAGNAPVTLHAVADQADCAHAPGSGRLRIAFDSAEAERLQASRRYTGALFLTLAPE